MFLCFRTCKIHLSTCLLVFSPFNAHFYPPLHHNGKGSITCTLFGLVFIKDEMCGGGKQLVGMTAHLLVGINLGACVLRTLLSLDAERLLVSSYSTPEYIF